MRRATLAFLLTLAVAAHAAPSREYAEEYNAALLESAAVIEAEVVDGPHEVPIERTQLGPNEPPVSLRLRVATLLAGEGLAAGDEFATVAQVPPLQSDVGDGPTDADRAAHRANWLGLLQPGSRWVFCLERSETPQGAVWHVRRLYDDDGPGRGDVDRRLALRRDTQAIATLLIELPLLAPYWHFDTAPERAPLILVHNGHTPRSLRLTKFGQPVLVLTREEIADRKSEAFLEVARLEVSGDTATAELRYEVEGVAAKVALARKDGAWVVLEATGGEH